MSFVRESSQSPILRADTAYRPVAPIFPDGDIEMQNRSPTTRQPGRGQPPAYQNVPGSREQHAAIEDDDKVEFHCAEFGKQGKLAADALWGMTKSGISAGLSIPAAVFRPCLPAVADCLKGTKRIIVDSYQGTKKFVQDHPKTFTAIGTGITAAALSGGGVQIYNFLADNAVLKTASNAGNAAIQNYKTITGNSDIPMINIDNINSRAGCKWYQWPAAKELGDETKGCVYPLSNIESVMKSIQETQNGVNQYLQEHSIGAR